MCNVFFVAESTDIASYADDTTPYVCLEDMDLINEKLEVKANDNFNGLMKIQRKRTLISVIF